MVDVPYEHLGKPEGQGDTNPLTNKSCPRPKCQRLSSSSDSYTTHPGYIQWNVVSTPECREIRKRTIGQSDASIVVHRPRADSRLFNSTKIQHDFGSAGVKVFVLFQVFEMVLPAGRKHSTIFNPFHEEIAEILQSSAIVPNEPRKSAALEPCYGATYLPDCPI